MNSFQAGVKAAIPFIRITGKMAGPVMVVMAGQHGRELNGIEIIRQVIMAVKSDPSFRGCCTFIPIANPPAVRMRQQDYPTEAGRYFANAPSFNLNRVWPGRLDGTFHGALAHTLWNKAIRHANVVIDLHGWTAMSHSLVWGYRRNAALVRAFGLEVYYINDNAVAAHANGMLEKACYQNGIASLTTELTPQNKLCAVTIAAGIRGVTNVMKKTGMLPGSLEFPARQIEFANRAKEHVVKAERGGLLVLHKEPPALLRKGEIFAEIVDLDNVLKTMPVKSPANGLLFNAGGAPWGERTPESSIVDSGAMVALVREIKRIIRHNRNNN